MKSGGGEGRVGDQPPETGPWQQGREHEGAEELEAPPKHERLRAAVLHWGDVQHGQGSKWLPARAVTWLLPDAALGEV